jgi:hypothetical protein
MYRGSSWSADGRFRNDPLFLPPLPPPFVASPIHYFYVSTLSFYLCVYTSLPVPFPFFVSYCLTLFVPLYLFTYLLLMFNFCFHTNFMLLLPRLPFLLPSCISFVSTMFLVKLCIFYRPSSLFSYVVSPVPVSAGW